MTIENITRRLLLTVGLLTVVNHSMPPATIAAGAVAKSTQPANAAPVSFRRQVLPILTNAGCNSGGCHGTPTGKNGFRLSLRGYDAELDITTLTREVHARRINPEQPNESLLLQKAIAAVPHGGGRRLDPNGKLYALLRTWIHQGAIDDSQTFSPLTRLEVLPAQTLLEAPRVSQQLSVIAHFADGSQTDVTHLARLTVNEEGLAHLEPTGLVVKNKRGEVTISAEYMNDFAAAQVTFLDADPDFHWEEPPQHNDIDQHVFAKLKRLRIPPSGLTTDAEFVRRVYLDVLGQLPTPAEVSTFLTDERPTQQKRNELIDDLLERPEFAEWWALKWSDRLGCNQRFVGKYGAMKYHNWIRHAMAVNMPEDEFVRAILTSGGPNYSRPAASFWRRLRVGGIGSKIDPQLAAEEISQLFLGVRIQCARCHNHPGERWTQNDYYGLSAFFPRIRFIDGPYVKQTYDKENTVYALRSGEISHPRTGKPVAPKFLGEPEFDLPKDADRRAAFARRLTAADNPFFARTSVNRIWYHLLGRGLVEPVDDFRSSNPASIPALLEMLTQEFIDSQFDRKQLIAKILKSRTYQLSSQTLAGNADDVKYFSHAAVRLLHAEQLMDAICRATGVEESFPGLPPGTRAVALPDGEYKHPFLEAFGRPARAMACECERDPNTNLGQALHLVSGQFVHDKLQDDQGRAARLAASELPAESILDELMLATLNRFPTTAERELLLNKLNSDKTSRRQVIEDILWALLNHNEFLFQH